MFPDILQWLFAGGGIAAILSIPYTIKKSKADAEKTIVETYQEYTSRIDEELEKVKKQSMKVEAKNDAYFEIIMKSYMCKIILQHEDEQCPVQNALEKLKKEEHNELDK